MELPPFRQGTTPLAELGACLTFNDGALKPFAFVTWSPEASSKAASAFACFVARSWRVLNKAQPRGMVSVE
jgi:hypothetical protein